MKEFIDLNNYETFNQSNKLYREYLAEYYEKDGELLVDLGSDQTSLHNPYNGGYYPVGKSFQEAQTMMKENPAEFKQCVKSS